MKHCWIIEMETADPLSEYDFLVWWWPSVLVRVQLYKSSWRQTLKYEDITMELMDTVDARPSLNERDTDKPLPLPVEDGSQSLDAVSGRIDRKKLTSTTKSKCWYQRKIQKQLLLVLKCSVNNLTKSCGDNVGVLLRGTNVIPERGQVIAKPGQSTPKFGRSYILTSQEEGGRHSFFNTTVHSSTSVQLMTGSGSNFQQNQVR